MIITILAFLFVLGILVLVHEFGHFVVAKLSGVKVEEFAFGFPPRLLSIKKGETRYSINAIPFGGYVKMLGELEHSTSPRAFENQTPGKRFAISVAGVVMNILLACMSPLVSDPNTVPGKKLSSEVIIADIKKDSPADKASLKAGDILISARAGGDSVDFKSANDVGVFTTRHQNETVKVVYKEEDRIAEKDVALSADSDAPLGVAVIERAIVRVPWYKSPYVALRETYEVLKITLELFGNLMSTLFTRGQVLEGVSGPVGIYIYSGLALRAGLVVFFQFIALLSINLALINILPFPALDGGRILFIILEKIRGKKAVREDVENIIHTVGFIILIILIIAITYRDIIKLF